MMSFRHIVTCFPCIKCIVQLPLQRRRRFCNGATATVTIVALTHHRCYCQPPQSPALLLLLRCAILCQSRRHCNSRPSATSSCMVSELPSCVLSSNNAATDMPRLHEVTQSVCALCANAVVHYGLSLGGIRSTSVTS